MLMKIDSNGNSWIAISEFHQQSYCEVQLKFKWQGIIRKTAEMTKGSDIHGQKFKDFQEETKELEEVDVQEAIKRALENKERFLGREVFVTSPTFRIFGVIDSIEIGPEGIMIADDKPSEYPFMSDKAQIIAYAIAFKDFYKPPLDIFMSIKNRDRGDIIWEDVLTQEWVEMMLENISRLHELALGKRDFEPTKNPKKCAACSYRDVCDKNILKNSVTFKNA
jgi:CRISPR/Cas system-associated exonuclease Cas4 (RecB family)